GAPFRAVRRGMGRGAGAAARDGGDAGALTGARSPTRGGPADAGPIAGDAFPVRGADRALRVRPFAPDTTRAAASRREEPPFRDPAARRRQPACDSFDSTFSFFTSRYSYFAFVGAYRRYPFEHSKHCHSRRALMLTL